METIYGRNCVLEALRAGRKVRALYVAHGVKTGPPISTALEIAGQRGIRVDWVPRPRLDQMTQHAGNQGIAADVEPFQYSSLGDLMKADPSGGVPLILALDSLQDPQNFGTLLRTAEAVGATGVIIPEHRSVAVTPAVCNASAGAVEHLRVAQVTNLARSLDELKKQGIWAVGLEVTAKSVPYDRADLTIPLVLVVGGEAEGVGRLVREKCDILIQLPMSGKINSLNAAVAGSVALYEILRQRQQGDAPRRQPGVK